MWDGNVWVPIGISAGQIVLAGTFDASSPSGVGKVQSLTPEGVAAGFVVNSALPVPTQGNNKHYFVVSEGGTITSGNAPAGVLAPPDLLLSVYSTTLPQWVEIDVSAGAGAIAAANVSFVPAGDIAASNVQTAIQEVSTECRNADNITSGTLVVARGGTNVASYTKGDLLAASAATTLTKLPVGTNGQVLRANSATATGLEYGADFVGTVTTVTSGTAALTVATATTTPALTVRAATTSVDGIVQLSDSTSTTSSVLAATPTAVKSAYDLAALALPAAGGTVTGELLIGSAGTLVFEGSTSDGNETTLAVADPTADRTITLPNQTGTVLVSGNASIVNADVNASAAIAGTKISPDFGSQTVATTGIFSHALGSAGAPTITFTGDANTGIYSPGADTLAFVEGGVEAMRIDSSGRVGIGTSSPGTIFDVVGSGNPTLTIRGSDGAYTGILNIQAAGGGASSINATGGGNALKLETAGTERARIDSSGRLLVGQTTTGLQAARSFSWQGSGEGTFYISHSSSDGSGDPFVRFGYNADQIGSIIQAGNTGIGLYSNDYLTLGSTNTERLRIDSSGNVGIGTSSPTTLLDVNADTIRVRTARTPASASATGATGEICWDANYIYVCTATNTWKRTAISTW
jgi:hypothetical protein